MAAVAYHAHDFEWERVRDTASQQLPAVQEGASFPEPYGTKEADADAQAWEDFHRRHATARFFKERRYLLAEFPVLAAPGPGGGAASLTVLELGCGSGCSALPILRGNPAARVVAVDCSQAAVSHAQAAVEGALGPEEASWRFHAFCCDVVQEDLDQVLAQSGVATWLLQQQGRVTPCEPVQSPRSSQLEDMPAHGEEIRSRQELESDSAADGAPGWRPPLEASQRGPPARWREEPGSSQLEACSPPGSEDAPADRRMHSSDTQRVSVPPGVTRMGQSSDATWVTDGCQLASDGITPSPNSPVPGLAGASRGEGAASEGEGDEVFAELGKAFGCGGMGGGRRAVDEEGAQEGWPGFDVVTLIFTLSAVHPACMPRLLARIKQVLRPGGVVLFRDYGLYDLAMLRFPPAQQVAPGLYRRADSTLACFFSRENLEALFTAQGFQQVESEYCCVELRHRRRNLPMARVWLHAVMQQPAQ